MALPKTTENNDDSRGQNRREQDKGCDSVATDGAKMKKGITQD